MVKIVVVMMSNDPSVLPFTRYCYSHHGGHTREPISHKINKSLAASASEASQQIGVEVWLLPNFW